MTPEQKFVAALELLGLVQARLARKIGVESSTISKWRARARGETGPNSRPIGRDTLEKIAPHLGVSLEWFYDGRDVNELDDLKGALPATPSPTPEASPIVKPLQAEISSTPASALPHSMTQDGTEGNLARELIEHYIRRFGPVRILKMLLEQLQPSESE